jgi:outer membrane protein OmpA-like peptidoglycan-associated protein
MVAAMSNDSRIIDLTAKADKSQRFSTRDPKKVYALVLHQMACCFKVKDPLTRFLKMAPHFAILPDGRILQLHPILSLTGASNGFNPGSVAVEFAGNFPDTRGKWWHGAENGQNQVTPAQIEAGRYLVRYLMRTMGLKVIVAHRQSSGTRDNDPGPDIWYHVGQWAIDTLGLKDGGPAFKTGTGNPIPDLWRTWGKAKPQPELEFSAYESEAWEGESNRSSSEYIRWVQQGLNRILGVQLAVDGIAGVQTKSAIRSFQTKQGLVVDGIVGPVTEAALVSAGAGPAPGSSAPRVSANCPAPNFVDCPNPGPTPTEVLDNFGHNVATLNRPLHTPLINRVAGQISASQSSSQPIRSVLIAGHTDPTGSDDFNFDLARRRAESVAQELCVAVGPALASRLTFNLTSCGERQLKATPELSRRVELFLPRTVSPPTQPGPAGKCGFRPSTRGFKFANSFSLPSSITGPLSRLGISVGAGAYGLCGGMSFLAGDHYSFGVTIPSTSTVPPIGSPLYNKLVRRQLDSLKLTSVSLDFAAPALKFWAWMGLPDTGRGSVAQKTAAEIAIINPTLRRSRFAVFGLVLVNRRTGSLTDNHQVLVYCLTQLAPNNFVYSIYDSNYPLRNDIKIEVQISRGEARVFHVVPARGGGAPTRTPVRGFFNMDYSPVRP